MGWYLKFPINYTFKVQQNIGILIDSLLKYSSRRRGLSLGNNVLPKNTHRDLHVRVSHMHRFISLFQLLHIILSFHIVSITSFSVVVVSTDYKIVSIPFDFNSLSLSEILILGRV